MLYELRFRLISEILGDQVSRGDPRRLKRADNMEGWLAVDVKHWRWAIHEAVKALGMRVDAGAVQVAQSMRSPTLNLFRRTYVRGQKTCHEMFESINSRTIISMDVLVPDVPEDENRPKPPSCQESTDIFGFIGHYIGVSPWGRQLGYGRFTVESFTPIDGDQIIREIRQRGTKLPMNFVSENREKADSIVILGHKLTELSKPEILAAAAFWHGLSNP